ncbi:MAG TPA: hypothetical protein PK448_05940 [Bacteroidales bacterium]|nr:hypothetical protein [Bacteroidales bacterium]
MPRSLALTGRRPVPSPRAQAVGTRTCSRRPTPSVARGHAQKKNKNDVLIGFRNF